MDFFDGAVTAMPISIALWLLLLAGTAMVLGIGG